MVVSGWLLAIKLYNYFPSDGVRLSGLTSSILSMDSCRTPPAVIVIVIVIAMVTVGYRWFFITSRHRKAVTGEKTNKKTSQILLTKTHLCNNIFIKVWQGMGEP